MSHQPGQVADPFAGINPADVNCSICLDEILDHEHQRGICKLHCGHFFHLACIGAEFNMRGVMVCPNCRNVEDSEWQYFQINPAQNDDEALDEEVSDDEEFDGEQEEEGIPDEIDAHNINNAYNAGSFWVVYLVPQATNGGFPGNEIARIEGMFGPFSYIRTFEVPTFDYGGVGQNYEPTPIVHYWQHTYVAPSAAATGLPELGLNISIDGGPLYGN